MDNKIYRAEKIVFDDESIMLNVTFSIVNNFIICMEREEDDPDWYNMDHIVSMHGVEFLGHAKSQGKISFM